MTQDFRQQNPSAEWLAHRYDPTHDAFQFHVIDRELRRSTPFLTDDCLAPKHPPLVIKRSDLTVSSSPIHFIFHSAYCCSTLLASAFDLPGSAMSLKEPVLLNDLVGWRQRGAAPDATGEATVIKPSNVVNGLATAMMSLRPQAKAILLYAPLEAYLTSIARKGMTGRLWVRELLSRQLVDGLVELGFAPRDYLLHTDLQAAAVGWLAQHRLFAIMADRWPDRVRTLDSEQLIAAPLASLDAASAFLGIAPPADGFIPVIETVFQRNAKDGSPFKPGQREGDRQQGQQLHKEEIERVAQWAQLVARNAGLPDLLPMPLLAN
ncbi:hypothetical protein LTR94_018799 [Friedmanniomyces endolithicus]|nr:hypothetical protein LTR94_018799 [Friedmanniomyces endolithicus]